MQQILHAVIVISMHSAQSCLSSRLLLFAVTLAAIHMAVLPAGWRSEDRDVEIFEWRCPRGVECGKHARLLYKQRNEADAIETGCRHRCNDECMVTATGGVTKSSRTWTIYFDEDGNEHEILPTKGKGNGKGPKGSGGGGGGGGGHHDDSHNRRTRSRSVHRRHRRRSLSPRQPDHPPTNLVLRSPGSGAVAPAGGALDVSMSRPELQEAVDCIGRGMRAVDQRVQFMQGAARTFQAEGDVLASVKRGRERSLRTGGGR